ncbi:hypothetical protein D9613_002067 [Agrocybe pediades]|uniref:Fibronectin type-III domain-containing protein n=1 Tax=Agrocybe pediades TaxID=84607 RepID=A0A8H4VXH6_9AGAR|nr:hypothetical protein D9613_002067 [Agrocybe pediades]
MAIPSLPRACLLAGIALWWNATFVQCQNHITPNLPLSFLFDWNSPDQPFPVPVTEQCETIHVKWSRSSATGPNPTAPYYLQLYTSNFIQPFVVPAGSGLSFDYTVPFAPGTLYQICMFDKFGNTGGCQDTYTVIPSSSGPPTCNNVTFVEQLKVDPTVDNGPMSQYGFVDQCTDISVRPTSGRPPYTLTVAPALHPPYNITSPDYQPINWTVSLSWASSFFVSLADSNGSMWSFGPLHAGSGGTTGCLTGFPSPKTIKPSVAVGTGIGGLAAGLIIGALVAFILLRRHVSNRFLHLSSRPGSPEPTMTEQEPTSTARGDRVVNPPSSLGWSPITSISSPIQRRQDSTVRPFMIPRSDRQTSEVAQSNAALARTASAVSQDPGTNSQVYVIHHDSTISPVTIFHQSGTEIVELPPRYPHRLSTQNEDPREDDNAGGNRAQPTDRGIILNEPRRPGEARKPVHTRMQNFPR